MWEEACSVEGCGRRACSSVRWASGKRSPFCAFHYGALVEPLREDEVPSAVPPSGESIARESLERLGLALDALEVL